MCLWKPLECDFIAKGFVADGLVIVSCYLSVFIHTLWPGRCNFCTVLNSFIATVYFHNCYKTCAFYSSIACRHWKDGILPYTLTELLCKQTASKEASEGVGPVAQWLIIDDSCCVPELLRMIHSPGMLTIPSRKSIMLPPELKIIVESDLLMVVAVPLLQLCPDDIGWEAVLMTKLAKSALPVVRNNATTIEGCFQKFMAKVFDFHFGNQDVCLHYLTVTACSLFEVCCLLIQYLLYHIFIKYIPRIQDTISRKCRSEYQCLFISVLL